MLILGISALYHDAAAALINDGEIIAGAQEERFTRIKHDSSIPEHAMKYCLEEAGAEPEDLDAVVYYDHPFLTMGRFLQNLRYAGRDAKDLLEFSLDSLLERKMWIHRLLTDKLGQLGRKDTLYVAEHHVSHAASAFFPSPYQKAVIITVDGVGEYA